MVHISNAIFLLALFVNTMAVSSQRGDILNDQQTISTRTLSTTGNERDQQTPPSISGLRNRDNRNTPPRQEQPNTESAAREYVPSISPSSAPSPPTFFIDCVLILVDIQTDYFPETISFEILDVTKQIQYLAYSDFTKPNYKYTFATCLDPTECYTFKLYDSDGNGTCCASGFGYYALWQGGELLGRRAGIFSAESEFSFGDGCHA